MRLPDSLPRLPLHRLPGRRRPDPTPVGQLVTSRRLRDFLLPASIDEAPDHLVVDDRFVATLAIVGYRRDVPLDWLSPLFHLLRTFQFSIVREFHSTIVASGRLTTRD